MELMQDGRLKVVLRVCPFDASHGDKDAACFETKDGPFGYKCFHQSCVGYGWTEFRLRVGIAPQVESAPKNSNHRKTKIHPPIYSVGVFCETYPHQREVVIDGMLRRGETGHLISSSKAGKSWLVLNLAVSMAPGVRWMGRDLYREGRTLLIDNELTRETAASRLRTVCAAFGVTPADVDPFVAIVPTRGLDLAVGDLIDILKADQAAGQRELIVIDAFYRSLPEGLSENDNAQMMKVYNHLDGYAELMDAAILNIHPASKGNQSSKSVTDVGSGAGAIARCVDSVTHACHVPSLK